MNDIRDIRNITVIIKDISVTIAAVLLIISMVHYDKYAGLYLGLSISNDSNVKQYDRGREGFIIYNHR